MVSIFVYYVIKSEFVPVHKFTESVRFFTVSDLLLKSESMSNKKTSFRIMFRTHSLGPSYFYLVLTPRLVDRISGS